MPEKKKIKQEVVEQPLIDKSGELLKNLSQKVKNKDF